MSWLLVNPLCLDVALHVDHCFRHTFFWVRSVNYVSYICVHVEGGQHGVILYFAELSGRFKYARRLDAPWTPSDTGTVSLDFATPARLAAGARPVSANLVEIVRTEIIRPTHIRMRRALQLAVHVHADDLCVVEKELKQREKRAKLRRRVREALRRNGVTA